MGMLRVLYIWLDFLTFCEILHRFMNDYFNFFLEGLFDFESYGSGGGFHFNFYDGQPRLLVFLGLSSSGGHGSGLGSG